MKRKFHKKTGPRRLFVKSLAHNLILEEQITTTIMRAKEVRSFVERLITLAKRQDVAHLRLLLARLPHRASAYKLFNDIAPRYKSRQGGYVRMVRVSGARRRDGAETAVVSFV